MPRRNRILSHQRAKAFYDWMGTKQELRYANTITAFGISSKIIVAGRACPRSDPLCFYAPPAV